MTPVFRRATLSDLESFYGQSPPRSVKAWVMELNGRIIAVGGLAYNQGEPWDLFSDTTPEARKFPILMIKGARKVLKEIESGVAIADENHPNSEKVLKMIGLKYIGENIAGKLYGRR